MKYDEKRFNIDHRVIGAESSLSPFLQHITSSRQAMFASQLKQAVHVKSEPSLISSGFEYQFNKLQLNPTLVEEPSTLIGYIPKALSERSQNIMNYTVFYFTNKDRIVKCFDMDRITLLNNGVDFCYLNNIQNTSLLMYGEGTHIPQGTSFTQQPSSINDMYYIGLNAKTIYMSYTDLLNDSVIISESLAEKMETYGCKEYIISLSENDIPLNIHGTMDDYRILPEIGDKIDSGILFAYRPADDLTVASDLSMESLMDMNVLHDAIYNCPKDAYIANIEVHINPNVLKSNTFKKNIKLKQFRELHELYIKYYKDIINKYEQIKERDLTISPEVNALVTHAMGMVYVDKHSIKDTPINFIECKINVVFPRKVNAGNKITCRAANKGVIAELGVWPDEYMPITENGIRADFIISDNSPFNRLNVGQWYEQFINYTGEIIKNRFNNSPDINIEEAFNYILSLKDIVAKTDKDILEKLATDDPEIKKKVIEEIKECGIYHCIPPFSKEITCDIFKEIMDRFSIDKVNWSFINPLTKEIVHSKYPTIIGDKYIYLLGKLPENSVHAVQIGFLNQFGLPMKEGKNTKQRNPYSNTVIRFGIDESCITSASVPTSSIARYMALNGNSLPAVKKMQHALSTMDKPTQLFRIDMTTKEMLDTSTNVAIFNHLMNCCGLDINCEKVHNLLNTVITKPFKVTTPKRQKVFTSRDPNIPHLVKIVLNDTEEVSLESLYNFQLVDYIMQSKKYIKDIKVYFSDNSCCKMKTNVGLFNFILWEIFVYFYIIPTKEDIYNIKNIKKDTASSLYTNIYYKLFEKDNYIFVLERLWNNINYINKFISLYLPAYNSTLCAIDIANTVNHPEMQKIIAQIPDEKIGMGNAEKILRSLTDQTISKILDGTIPSELKKFLETDSLNIQQVGQMLIAFGPRDDIDGEIPRYVIQNSCFSGLQSVEDFATESLSVKKSMFFNKTSIEEAGVFGKHFRIVGESQISLYSGSCGNTHTSTITIKPSWKKGFIDRIIIDNDIRVKLTESNINNYINKPVNMINPINCNHQYGICEECAGYGDPGVLRKFIIPGTIIGTVSSSQLSQFIMQFILSNKHLNKTDSFVYNLNYDSSQFFEKRSGNVYWKPGLETLIRSLSMKIPINKIGNINDLLMEIKAPDSWSSINEIVLVDTTTNETKYTLTVKDSVIIPFLSVYILSYMKKVYNDIIITEDDHIIIPLNLYNFSKPLLKYNIMNQDMRAYVKKARSFFNSEISKMTEIDVLEAAYELIYSKTTLPSYFIDVVLKAYRVERYEKDGKLKLKFANTASLLDRRDITSKLRHEKMNAWLSKPTTYTANRQPAIAEVFFNF